MIIGNERSHIILEAKGYEFPDQEYYPDCDWVTWETGFVFEGKDMGKGKLFFLTTDPLYLKEFISFLIENKKTDQYFNLENTIFITHLADKNSIEIKLLVEAVPDGVKDKPLVVEMKLNQVNLKEMLEYVDDMMKLYPPRSERGKEQMKTRPELKYFEID